MELIHLLNVIKPMKKLDEIDGSMCDCRTSDMPSGIIEEFEKIGFSKGTDYFFGRLNGLNVKTYLNKDARGIWLDLAVRSSMDALGIDLLERSSIKTVIERVVDEISLYLNKARI